MNNVALKIGLCRDLTGDGIAVIPAGVSLIVSNGLGSGPCHELALAIIRDCLVRGEIGDALVFSRMKRLKSRLLTFAEGVEAGGCFNGWSVKRKDILLTIGSMGRDSAWIDGNSLQYHESELTDEVRRELGFFGKDLIMLDLEFPDFCLLSELRKMAVKMKRRILVTSSFPIRTCGGNLTLPAIEIAAQTACGRGVMELAEAVACIQDYQTGSTDSDVVVEVLKGQFFATRSKVEQKNVRKKGFITMARSLLNSFV